VRRIACDRQVKMAGKRRGCRPGIGHYRRNRTFHFRGFSLIEVMIVVGIVALLVSLAIPSYQEFIMKSRRTEAKELLLTAAQRQQQHFTMNNVYSTDAVNELKVPTTSTNGYYTLSIAAGPTGSITTSYAMSATAVAGSSQADDSACGTFTLNSLGVKTVSGSQTSPPCW